MNQQDRDGLFIVCEGIDGSGKSTLVDAAEEALQSVITTREPSPHWTGPYVRKAIESDTHPMTDFHFFLGDRANLIKKTIAPALKAGKLVVSDRGPDSTRAYQGEKLKDVVDDPQEYIEMSMQDWVIEPDIVLLLDIPAEVSAKRTSDGDKYEESEFLKSVRQNYLDRAEDNAHIITVDATMPLEDVIHYCVSIIAEAQSQALANATRRESPLNNVTG